MPEQGRSLSRSQEPSDEQVPSPECCQWGCTCVPGADCTCDGCTGNYEDTPGGY